MLNFSAIHIMPNPIRFQAWEVELFGFLAYKNLFNIFAVTEPKKPQDELQTGIE
jgi:hypothetical protein